jgi:phosphopantetheinyl transferase
MVAGVRPVDGARTVIFGAGAADDLSSGYGLRAGYPHVVGALPVDAMSCWRHQSRTGPRSPWLGSGFGDRSKLRPAGMALAHPAFSLVHERCSDDLIRHLVMRRYLGRDERRQYESRSVRGQRQFLLGRIAVKHAVRRWLGARDHGPIFPAEIVVANDAHGRPLVRGPFTEDLRVSIAHAGGLGVALVDQEVDVGIDVEKVEPRSPTFEQLALTGRERQLDAPAGYDRDTWLTCLWAVKEAAAKASGQGLRGRPKDYEVLVRREHKALVGDRWVAFERLADAGADPDIQRKEHVVAWTLTRR